MHSDFRYDVARKTDSDGVATDDPLLGLEHEILQPYGPAEFDGKPRSCGPVIEAVR